MDWALDADRLRTGHVDEDVEMVRHERVGQHDNATEPLYAAHQRNRAVLLLVVEEERPVRQPAHQMITPVLLDNPVLSHVGIIPKTRLLYCPFIPGVVFECYLLACAVILHLVSCDRVPNTADVRIYFLYGNFAAWHTTQSPWNQAYTV